MKKKRERKEMEYPDAPSGYVFLYNYKETFMDFEYEGEGYGYQGVLLFDGSSDKIQCHFCGGWYKSLGHHIHREHNMKASAYKDIVGLRQTTALVGEDTRAKMIENGLDKRLQNLRKGGKKTQAEKDKISNTLKRVSRETENEKGTCPFQLLDRLQNKADELGRCPTTNEIGFCETLRRVYGSFNNACQMAGLEPLKIGQTLVGKTYTKENTTQFIKDFYHENNRFPKAKEFKSQLAFRIYSKNRKEINTEVLISAKKFHKTGVKMRYTKETLLEIIKTFIETNNRMPSISDCKRGLLPHTSNYYYHFGSLKKALELL